MKADAKCIHCSVKLEVGENFLESQAKIKSTGVLPVSNHITKVGCG